MPTTPEQPEQTDTDTPTMTYRGAVAPASWGPRIPPNGSIYYPEIFTSESQILEHWKSGVIQVGDYLIGESGKDENGWICGSERYGRGVVIWVIPFDRPKSGFIKPGYWSQNYIEKVHRIYRNDFARENRKKQNDKKPLLTDIATLVGSIPVAAVASRAVTTMTTVEADASGRIRSLEQEVRRLNNLISEIGARASNDYDAAQSTISRLVERVDGLVRRADTTQGRLGRVERILRDQGASRETYTPVSLAQSLRQAGYNDFSTTRTPGTVLVTKAKYVPATRFCPACQSDRSAGFVMWYEIRRSGADDGGFCCRDCIRGYMKRYQDYIWDFEQLPPEFDEFKRDLLAGRITSDNPRATVSTGTVEPENKRPQQTTTEVSAEDKPVVVSPRRAPVVIEEDLKINNNSLAKMAPRSSPTQPGQKTPWAPSVKPRR